MENAKARADFGADFCGFSMKEFLKFLSEANFDIVSAPCFFFLLTVGSQS